MSALLNKSAHYRYYILKSAPLMLVFNYHFSLVQCVTGGGFSLYSWQCEMTGGIYHNITPDLIFGFL